VRVAIALVIGQATLCAVIGWLTVGPGSGGAQAGKSVDPVAAAPPAVMPTASIGQPAAPMPLPPAQSSAPPPGPRHTQSSVSVRTSTHAAEGKGRHTDQQQGNGDSPMVGSSSTTPPAHGDLPALPPPPPPNVAATPTPTPGDVQEQVVEGTVCDPVDALGLTVDDDRLKCVKDADGELRWQAV
jgi:hypothetical protein